MQDRYAFDLGDFSKIGLVRLLNRVEPTRRMGVIWYATAPTKAEQTRDDGKHIAYLCHNLPTPKTNMDRMYRCCDETLYDAMRNELCSNNCRTIAALENLASWPPGTLFYSALVPTNRLAEQRKRWHKQALQAMSSCDLVICDPDNGIGWQKTGGSRTFSAKHILPAEITDTLDTGFSMIIYHHCDRSAPHLAQASRHAERLHQLHPSLAEVITLRFRRGSSRFYFLLVQPKHERWILNAITALRESPWVTMNHFQVISES